MSEKSDQNRSGRAASSEETARRKSRAYNSPYEQELFLAKGGTLAQWYAQAAPPPVETPADILQRQRARILAQMPEGLDEAKAQAWIEFMSKRSGIALQGPAVEPDSAERQAIRAEFAAFCDAWREKLGL